MHSNAIMGANFYFKRTDIPCGSDSLSGQKRPGQRGAYERGLQLSEGTYNSGSQNSLCLYRCGRNSSQCVQDHATVRYEVRAPYVSQVKELYERVVNVAKGAAMMAGTNGGMRTGDGIYRIYSQYGSGICGR